MPRTSKDDRAARAVRWLHLSDLHFRVGQTWDQRATLRALIRKLKELRIKGLTPDLIFVTGDIAWSGKRDEYEQAQRFFTEVMEATEVTQERWFVVPGNHDVDQSKVTKFHGPILGSLQAQEDIEALFKDPSALMMLAPRMSEFYDFTGRFLDVQRGWSHEKPWRVDSRTVNGVSIGILQLNSTWAGGTNDDKRNGLLVGAPQISETLLAVEDAHLRIALMHHSAGDLREFDRDTLESLLRPDSGAHFVLRGHLHKTKTAQQLTPDGGYFEIAAGALYSADNYPRAFNFVELDLGGGKGEVHLFRYSEESGGFWAADTQTYEQASNGIARLKLPKKLKLTPPSPAPDPNPVKDKNIAFRYRAASAAYHGHARFIGFAQTRQRPNAQVEELFVPLTVSLRNQAKQEIDSWTTLALAQHLIVDGGAARIVVLGDPGSGKTTLTRFLIGVAAGTVPLEGLQVKGEPLPIRVGFRDYVQRAGKSDLSLIEYIEQQARTELSVPLPAKYVERALSHGDAVVLFDGLDEVGTAEDRIEMRDRLAAFCRTYPNAPMLLTSRIAGYDDAPFGDATGTEGSSPFVHVTLTPFTDQQLEEFVQRWYALQERTDAAARLKGIKDLLSAMKAAPRVKELARSPLLATLIAMIHRVQATLPGDRAKLYELCIQTMLETWPGTRGRRFREIDEGLQRLYLEELAWTMQKDRTDTDKSVVVDRATLANRFVDILRARDYMQQPPEVVSRLVERWIDYLAEGTGLLVEQSAGVFGFFHLSFLEYLAARAFERHLGRQTLGQAIAQQLRSPMWSEVCLLAVGWHANDAALLDDLMDHVAIHTPSGIDFLLSCMREEARFSAPQREKILRAVTTLTHAGFRYEEPIRGIIDFSVRNGKAVEEWLADQLRTARGPALRAASIIATLDLVRENVANRADAADATADLLSLGGSAVRHWAARHITPESALRFLDEQAAYGDLPLRSLAALRTGKPVWAALLTLQLTKRAMLGSAIPTGAATRAALEEMKLPLRHRLPSRRDASTLDVEPLGRLTDELAMSDEAFLPNRRMPLTAMAEVLKDSSLALLDGRKGVDGFDAILPRLSRLFFRRGPLDFPFKFILSSEPVGDFPSPRSRAPHQAQWPGKLEVLFAAEAYAGLLIARPRLRRDIRIGYANARLQHRYVIEEWPALESEIPDNLPPHHLAIYLALGWTAATTTWRWPGTQRWIDTIDHKPEHWLPLSQWHLCWLTYDPDDVPHRQALEDALKDGDKDPELPGFAAKMREILGNDKPRKPKATAIAS